MEQHFHSPSYYYYFLISDFTINILYYYHMLHSKLDIYVLFYFYHTSMVTWHYKVDFRHCNKEKRVGKPVNSSGVLIPYVSGNLALQRYI
jgi:hypothetical protein